jgi:hypothetical protein
MIDQRNPIPTSFLDWFEAISLTDANADETRLFLQSAAALAKNQTLQRILGLMEARCLMGVRDCPVGDTLAAEKHRLLLRAIVELRGNLEGFATEAEMKQKS